MAKQQDKAKQEEEPAIPMQQEFDPVSGQNVEVPAYIDFINPDGTPHYNYNYFQGFQPPPPTAQQQALRQDRQIYIQPYQGTYRPSAPTFEELQAWRPQWIQT